MNEYDTNNNEDWTASSDENVYEMIVKYGGPGLWIRRTTWGNTCARIVALGRFTRPAPYFGSPPVLMDVYTLDGQPKQALAQVPVPGTYKTWRRWPEPEWAKTTRLRPLNDRRIAAALKKLDRRRFKLSGAQSSSRTPSTEHPNSNSIERVELRVAYRHKERAKQIGARWDPSRKVWWLNANDKAGLEQAKQFGFLLH